MGCSQSYGTKHLEVPARDPHFGNYACLFGVSSRGRGGQGNQKNWVAFKELLSSYYFGETLLFTIYTHYGNLF